MKQASKAQSEFGVYLCRAQEQCHEVCICKRHEPWEQCSMASFGSNLQIKLAQLRAGIGNVQSTIKQKFDVLHSPRCNLHDQIIWAIKSSPAQLNHTELGQLNMGQGNGCRHLKPIRMQNMLSSKSSRRSGGYEGIVSLRFAPVYFAIRTTLSNADVPLNDADDSKCLFVNLSASCYIFNFAQ